MLLETYQPSRRGGSYIRIIENPLVYGAQIVLLVIRIDHNMFTLVSSFGNPPRTRGLKKIFFGAFLINFISFLNRKYFDLNIFYIAHFEP